MVKRFIVALPLALMGAGWFYVVALPWPVLLRWRDPARTAFMEYRLEEAEARGEELELRQQWVPLAEISPHLRRAVVVAEDARFFDHEGIDWQALREEFRYRGDTAFSWSDPADLRALAASFRYYRGNRDKVRGRSTITQQVAKNLYLSADRSAVRKAEEFLIARRLERFLPKERILEVYLNTAEWGPGIFGAEAAAIHYFGRPAARLTRDQAAALAATLPHPLTSNPKHRPGRMAWRKGLILARMGSRGPVTTVPLAPPAPELPVIENPLGEAAQEIAPPPVPVPDPVADPAAPPPPADTIPEREPAPDGEPVTPRG